MLLVTTMSNESEGNKMTKMEYIKLARLLMKYSGETEKTVTDACYNNDLNIRKFQRLKAIADNSYKAYTLANTICNTVYEVYDKDISDMVQMEYYKMVEGVEE